MVRLCFLHEQGLQLGELCKLLVGQIGPMLCCLRMPLSAHETSSRTRVFKGASESGPWELWQRAPHPQLRHFTHGLWAGMTSRPGARHRVLPNGEVMLMLHVGPTQRLTERDGSPSDRLLGMGFIAGLQERPATYESFAPATRVVSARLTPIGAWTLLHGVPQSELAHQMLELDSVLPARSGIASLREHMHEVHEFGRALDLLEAWLLERAQRGCTPHAATQTANTLLRQLQDAPSVSALSRACGVSPRRLHELFLEQVGVSAKRILRIHRFRRALDCMSRAPDAPLSEVALACGYYDQPHFYRDFRALANMTPLAYCGTVQDDIDDLDGPDVIGS